MSEEFAIEIEKLCSSKNIPYMDGIILYCEKHGYEIESIALLIRKDPVLRGKIKHEAETANLLKSKRGRRLPI